MDTQTFLGGCVAGGVAAWFLSRNGGKGPADGSDGGVVKVEVGESAMCTIWSAGLSCDCGIPWLALAHNLRRVYTTNLVSFQHTGRFVAWQPLSA